MSKEGVFVFGSMSVERKHQRSANSVGLLLARTQTTHTFSFGLRRKRLVQSPNIATFYPIHHAVKNETYGFQPERLGQLSPGQRPGKTIKQPFAP
jgi:hypothetical protein